MRFVLTVPDLVVNRCQGFQLNYSDVNKSSYACLKGRLERSLQISIRPVTRGGGARGAFAPPTGPKAPHFDTQYPS